MTQPVAKLEEIYVRVERIAKIASDIYSYDLRQPDENHLPEFTPGSHITVRTPNGLLRKYSLCNDPSERYRYEIAVKKEPMGRGGSVAFVEGTRTGDTFPIYPPRNDFPMSTNPAGCIFIAGGIGITPIMSMMRHLISTNRTRFKLYYCSRSPEQSTFLQELSAPEFQNSVKIHHDQGDPARVLDLWPILEQPKGQHLYCCGPDPLMRAVKDMTGHWSPTSVHFESFADERQNAKEDRPFSVRLMRSGEVIHVPVGMTILQALRAKGCDVPSSCESGTCGTCRTRLIGGEADHRDFVLSENEKTSNIMICVSRALSSELVIDR